ncbi:MAG: CRTAC1 family protein [Acidobacteria bacterium]|nr:CRTAC1 family protein [Acidobacteriota bacterium]
MSRYFSLSFILTAILLFVFTEQGLSQGMASGTGKAHPASPLPKGMKPPKVDYLDLAKEAGLVGRNISGSEQNKEYIVETTGTGAAIFDYNRDGWMDILLVNASKLDLTGQPPRHYLYQNLGGLRFEDVTVKAGLTPTGWGQGVCVGDMDNDAYPDLFITQWGQNVLLRNQGDGTFRDETARRNLRTGTSRWSTGCAFLDYDRDGHLDLFVAHYLEFDPKTTSRPGDKQCTWKGLPVICGPRGLPAESMSLFRNDGRGNFTDVSQKTGVAVPKLYYGFTVLTGDYDNDGWPDVYVACDSTPSLLFHNQRDGTFEEVGVFSGAAVSQDGREQAGMGAAAGDFDGDGWLDIFKTNFSDDVPNLYRNAGNLSFSDITISAGLAVNTKYLGWGAAFLDFDLDGRKDIFQANGHVYPGVENAAINEKFKQLRTLYWNRGDGQFFDISAQAGTAIQTPHCSRGIALGDLDNDGTLEILVVNLHEPPSLLKNSIRAGNSMLVEALTRTGRDAIGARLTLLAGGRRQIEEIRSGGYHISQGDFRAHFGLGKESKAQLQIRWPDGSSESFGAVTANQWITVQQGKGIIRTRSLAGKEK